ncbi:MAG: hypothetical protein RPR97_02010 [Colwellia sp.]|jgi:hypothetical protein
MSYEYVIVGGTEKAATTSLYQYLIDSDLFNRSIKKETDYFRGAECSLENYLNEFESTGKSLYVEASPGYLAESEVSAKRMRIVLGDKALVIFILRSPLERLISSFKFHKSRLFLPRNMGFDEYIDLCRSYEAGIGSEVLGLDKWFLKVPDAGLYHKHMIDFVENGYAPHVVEFSKFVRKPSVVLDDILKELDVSTVTYKDYSFETSNKTEAYKFVMLQRFALFLNDSFEAIFYRFPVIKRLLKKGYWALNKGESDGVSVSDENLKWLKEFYQKDIFNLYESGYICDAVRDVWLSSFSNGSNKR